MASAFLSRFYLDMRPALSSKHQIRTAKPLTAAGIQAAIHHSLLRLMKGIPTSWESSQQKLDVLLLCCQLLNCKATMTSSILVALKHPCNSGTHHFKENHLKKRRETIPQKIVLCGFLSRRLPKSKVNGLTNIYIIVSTCGKKYIWIRGTPPCWVHS